MSQAAGEAPREKGRQWFSGGRKLACEEGKRLKDRLLLLLEVSQGGGGKDLLQVAISRHWVCVYRVYTIDDH